MAKLQPSHSDSGQVKQEHRLFFDAIPIPMLVYDPANLAILDVNAAAVHQYGHTGEDFVRLKITDIWPDEGLSAPSAQVSESTKVVSHKKKSGESIEVEIRSCPLTFAGANARLVIALDITQKRRAESALREGNDLFRLMILSVKNYAIMTLDTGGHVISWNEGAERTMGYPAEEIIGQHFSVFYSSEEIETGMPSLDLAQALRQGRFEEEGWRVRKDASKFWANVALSALRDQKGTLLGFGNATRDVTERRRIEQSHLVFRGLFESLPGLYLVLTPDLKIAAVSDAYLQATMTVRDEILGRGVFDVFPANPNHPEGMGVSNLQTSLSRVLELGITDTMAIDRYDIRSEDGVFVERFWSPINSPVFGLERKIEYIVHRVEDVTEFVRAKKAAKSDDQLRARVEKMEAEAFRSTQEIQRINQEVREANRELESFSYSVSHDLRAPLRAIDGFSQALLEDYGQQLDSTGQDCLQRVRAATKRMGLLIDDLLNLSRVTRAELHRETIEMSSLANLISAELRKGDEARRADFVIAPDLWAEGDSRLIRVALENLLGNAWKFTSKTDCARIEFGQSRKDQPRTFYVRDNGAGFDSAHASRLFGAFQRLHSANEFPGTGIGLATVQRIIHRHGGRVWAESSVGQGATFFFTL